MGHGAVLNLHGCRTTRARADNRRFPLSSRTHSPPSPRSVHRGSYFAELRTTTVRKLLPESWGFLCPVHTPDGSPCGLLNHFTAACSIITEGPAEPAARELGLIEVSCCCCCCWCCGRRQCLQGSVRLVLCVSVLCFVCVIVVCPCAVSLERWLARCVCVRECVDVAW